MKILIASDARFVADKMGQVWIPNASSYDAWARYLDIFDQVDVLARVAEATIVPANYLRADGPGVRFIPMPYYQGPAGYLRHRISASVTAREAVQNAEAILLRGPGQIAYDTHRSMARSRPFGVEVLGDPYDVYAAGAVKHPLRPLFRVWFTRQQKRVVSEASSVAYVTERYLQQRYFPSREAFATSYSDLGYSDDMFVNVPRRYDAVLSEIRAVTVGSLDQMYKGIDVLLEALSECRLNGINMTLTVVGDGRHRRELEDLARSLRVSDHVSFLGQLPSGDSVKHQLDLADLFVLPSRTEGLPRAVIEAMARGLPSVGTTVGGMSELLHADDLVSPGDATALANKIQEVVTKPERMSRMSWNNVSSAKRFSVEEVRRGRSDLLKSLRDQTQEWLNKGQNR